jgi:TPR repeat protein
MKLAAEKIMYMEEVYAQADYLFSLGFCDLSYKLFCVLAAENHPESLNRLAHFHLSGCCVKKNKNKALFFFKKAARLKDSAAMLSLGLLYRDDLKMYGEALYWFRLLEKDKKTDQRGKATIELASMYSLGLGVKRDIKKSQKMLEKLKNNTRLFEAMPKRDQDEVFNKLAWISAVKDKEF